MGTDTTTWETLPQTVSIYISEWAVIEAEREHIRFLS